MTRSDRKWFSDHGFILQPPKTNLWQLVYNGKEIIYGNYGLCMWKRKHCLKSGNFNQFKLEIKPKHL